MPYQTLNNFNGTGTTGIIQYTSSVVPIFVPMMLFTVYCIIALGSYFTQRRLTGRGSFFASMAVGGYITSMISFFMMLIPNLINPVTLGIVLAITIFSTIMLLLTQD